MVAKRKDERVALALLEALRKDNPRALLQGGTDEGEVTLIDGRFNLRKVARGLLLALGMEQG